jgi:hypothetical protein
MEEYPKLASEILDRIRCHRPVVHSITNYVVMNSTANVLLAMGASPIMAHAPEEIEDIMVISNSMVINIGTLSKHWIESMSCSPHRKIKKPCLDPVGAVPLNFASNGLRHHKGVRAHGDPRQCGRKYSPAPLAPGGFHPHCGRRADAQRP